MWSLLYTNEKSFQTYLILGDNPYLNIDNNKN